ncbi:MAG: RNA methyltransferase [Terrimonas sp.]|nr:RNA methyltransferase [Terrimonas sp.]
MTPERLHKLVAVLEKRQPDITLILENVFDPHNISAVMRTCDAVGVQEIFVLNTKIPPHKKWGPRSSSSAAKWITVHQFEDTDACIREVRSRYQRILTTHLSREAISLYDIDFTGSIALVFGNEHAGVTETISKLCDGNFVIPQVGIIRSLNISVACAVTLYEAYRQKKLAGHYERQRLRPEQHKRLLDEWGMGETN